MIKDPICGMNVNPRTAVASVRYRGQTYYFCSQLCRMMFEREPEKYVKVEETGSTKKEALMEQNKQAMGTTAQVEQQVI